MLSSDQIKNAVSGFLNVPVERLTDSSVLTDLVVESFLLVEMVMFLQDEFTVRIIQEDLKTVHTVGDLVKTFQEKDKQK